MSIISQLESQYNKLSAQVKATWDALKPHQDKPVDPPSTLVLKSPNGKHKITFLCTNMGAGIWVEDGDASHPVISIYNGFDQGAVVGVFGPKGINNRMCMDAALTADDKGGYLMLTDEQSKPVFARAEHFKEEQGK